MTFSLISRTILAEGVPDDTGSTPFGRTGCCLLPDGTYLVSVYYDTNPTDIWKVWKVGTDGTVLGSLTLDTGGDTDGRMHLIELDGYLVQVLYMTGTFPGGHSYVIDASGNDPVIVDDWADGGGAAGHGGTVHHLYLRSIGVVAVGHRYGMSLYRRGRHLVTRGGTDATGEIYGIFPHPTDERKFAAWYSSGDSVLDYKAWEYTVTESDALIIEDMGIGVPAADLWWMVGGGSPYAATPIILQQLESDALGVTTAADPATALWTDPNFTPVPVTIEGEALWSRATNAEVADTANEYWVGAAPRLTDADDATYAHIGPDQAAGVVVAAKLPAVTLPEGKGLSVTARIKLIGWSVTNPNFSFQVATEADSTPVAATTKIVYSYLWGAFADIKVFIPYSAPLAAALAAGNAVVWAAPPNDTSSTDSYEVSNISVGVASVPSGINADTISTQLGGNDLRFAFAHEVGYDNGVYPSPTGPAFAVRCGIVDNTTGTPDVEYVDLQYGATSPGGMPYDNYYVSLITGSHSMHHRNGEIVVATCVVQQELSPNYYSVISWKLTGGELATLSRLDDDGWKLGINNGTGLLTQQSTSDGLLVEAGEGPGLDAPAQPLWIKGSDKWILLGRFCVDGAPALGEPTPPATVDITYELTDINTDLAAAQTLAGATYGPIGGLTWGAFVAQASPPSAADLSDGSTATFTTLVHPDNAGGAVEVFTARLTPTTPVPPGAMPLHAAFTVNSQAPSGTLGTWPDGAITPGTSQAAVRGKAAYYNLTQFDAGPAWKETSYGVYQRQSSLADQAGRFIDNYATAPVDLPTALGRGDENCAVWWADKLDDPAFYIVVQHSGGSTTQGDINIAGIKLTVQYLVP